jgi:hypothetical protein
LISYESTVAKLRKDWELAKKCAEKFAQYENNAYLSSINGEQIAPLR